MRARTKMSVRKVVMLTATAIVLLTSGLVVVFNLGDTQSSMAAVSGDYRVKVSGAWSTAGTWEKYNGTSWATATTSPTSADGTITIQNGFTVTVSSSVSVDQVVVASGGQITITNGTLTIANGTGTDLQVDGTLDLSSNMTLANSADISIGGSAILRTGNNLNCNTNSLIVVSGTFQKDGGTMTTTAGIWTFANHGMYIHNQNGSAIPNATWATGSTCKITGVTSTVPNNLDQAFYNFTWDCPSESGNHNLSGNLTTINGDFTLVSTGGYYIKLNGGSSTLTIGGSFIQSGGTLDLSSANNAITNLNITGDLALSGGILSGGLGNGCQGFLNVTGSWLLTGGTLTIGGNPQSSTEIVFNHSGTQGFDPGGTTISGNVNFTVNSGTTLDLGTGVLTGTGTFTLQSGAGLLISSSAGITSSGASGAIQVSGTRAFSSGADYTYNGTSSQVTGNGLPSTVHNLTISNSAGLTLSATTTVSNMLSLLNGKITTGIYELSTTNTSTSSVAGYSSNSYIVGNLRRSVAASGSYDFPLGTATNYELLNINLSSITGFSNLLGSFVQSNPLEALLPLTGVALNGTIITDVLDYGYWSLTPNSTILTGTYDVTLYETGQSVTGPNAQSHCVLKRSSIAFPWASLGTHSNSTQTMSGNTISAKRTGLSSFSHYAIGFSSKGALPIELMYFNAKLNNDEVDLDWATAAEINNDYFTIERSDDGIHFNEIHRQPGSGNSTSRRTYSATDNSPMQGYSYYRLKQTDYDGRYTYSEIKTVKYKSSGMNDQSALNIISIAPNPFVDRFTLTFMLKKSMEAEIQLISSNGEMIFSEHMQTTEGVNQYAYTDERGLPPGIYFVNLICGEEKQTQKIIKR